MPHGIHKATDLIAQHQPPGDPAVFASGDELGRRRGEAISGQLTGLLQNATEPNLSAIHPKKLIPTMDVAVATAV